MTFITIIAAKKKIIHDGFFNDYLKTDYNFDQFDNAIVIEAKLNGLDPKVLKAIGLNESLLGYDKRSESIGNTKNLMHVTDATADRFGITREQLDNPKLSIKASAKYLGFLAKEFNGNLDHIVMAYNGGEGRMHQILNGEHKTNSKVNLAYNNMEDYRQRFYRNLERLG